MIAQKTHELYKDYHNSGCMKATEWAQYSYTLRKTRFTTRKWRSSSQYRTFIKKKKMHHMGLAGAGKNRLEAWPSFNASAAFCPCEEALKTSSWISQKKEYKQRKARTTRDPLKSTFISLRMGKISLAQHWVYSRIKSRYTKQNWAIVVIYP